MKRIFYILIGHILAFPFYMLTIILPYKAHITIGKLLGLTLYKCKLRRSIVEKNLQIAFEKEKTKAELKEICKQNYIVNGIQIWIYAIHALRFTNKYLAAILDLEKAWELVRETTKDDPGFVGLNMHTTSLISSWLTLTLPKTKTQELYYLYASRNVFIEYKYSKSAYKRGKKPINRYNKKQMMDLIRNFRNDNTVIYTALDTNVPNKDLFVTFFSKQVSIGKPMFELIIKHKKPVYLMHAEYQGKNQPSPYIIQMQKLNYTITGDKEKDVQNLASLYTSKIEEYVKTCPEQYYWVHRRFKTRPDGEAPRY